MRNDDVAMVLNGAFAPTHRKVEEFFEDFFLSIATQWPPSEI